MFTGIIQAVGTINLLRSHASDCRLEIAASHEFLEDTRIGDSIAVDGVCLTVIELKGPTFSADVSTETLSRTILEHAKAGDPVNLETALTLRSRIGGHIVTGHIDGVGKIINFHQEGRSVRFLIAAPAALAKYIAVKGSICVNGISLTVNSVSGSAFEVNIVPHTLSNTTLGSARQEGSVNLEVDIVARYLERLVEGENVEHEKPGITADFLRKSGF